MMWFLMMRWWGSLRGSVRMAKWGRACVAAMGMGSTWIDVLARRDNG